MISVKEAILVEGKYDKIKLSSLVDTVIVETNGFSVYKDAEKQNYIKMLAEERGLIILTDSDNAGRQIRSYISSFVPADRILHAYIPDIYGKEKRKQVPSKEGKLGVEGIPAAVLLKALEDAGAAAVASADRKITLTAADCMELGLTGAPNSAALRKSLLKALSLPENLSLKQLMRWVDTEEKLSKMLDILENFEANA